MLVDNSIYNKNLNTRILSKLQSIIMIDKNKKIKHTSTDDIMNFQILFQKARNMTRFKDYSDKELKESLIKFIFSSETTPSNKKSKTDSNYKDENNLNIEKVFNEIEKVFKEERTKNEAIQKYKNEILDYKKQSLEEIKTNLPLIFNSDSINKLLFKLAKKIKIYKDNIFWDFYQYKDKDFKLFKKRVTIEYYSLKTSTIEKMWYRLSGQKQNKIKQMDPFMHIVIAPFPNRKKNYGTNTFKARSQEEKWLELAFGTHQSKDKEYTINNYSELSLNNIINNLSKEFDFILSNANIKIAISEENINEANEGLIFKFISESFLAVIKIFTTFEHIVFSVPFTENHPLHSIHLLYFTTWCYVKWISFLEKTLYERKSYITPYGETGTICLIDIFKKIKENINDELENSSSDLNSFYDQFHKHEQIIKNIDLYIDSIRELKKRFKSLVNSLLGDLIKDYFVQNDIILNYNIDNHGNITIDNAIKMVKGSLITKIMSFFKPIEEEKPVYIKPDVQIQKEPLKPMSIFKEKINYSTKKDYSSYRRILEDLFIITFALSKAFNDNFDLKNQFKPMYDKVDKYSYLKSNTFFTSHKDIDFEQIMKLQDSFDGMIITKVFGEELIKEIKEKKEQSKINTKINEIEEYLTKFYTKLKDSSGILGILSQNRANYEKYTVLLNKFYIIYTEFEKVTKEIK